jgi:hypothetical protein
VDTTISLAFELMAVTTYQKIWASGRTVGGVQVTTAMSVPKVEATAVVGAWIGGEPV